MQLILVAIIIFWPGLVTSFIGQDASAVPAVIEAPAQPAEDPAAEIERQLRQQR
jgi:hypothetical protein